MNPSEVAEPLKVFVSYTHDSRDHSQRVLELANALRDAGFDCDLDQYHVNQSWPAWMERRIAWAENVLVVCTPTYLRRWNNEEKANVGLGAQWESLLTRQHLYESPGVNEKFVPVLVASEHVHCIPKPLSDVTRIDLSRVGGFESLRRRLLKIPPAEKPPIRTSLAPVQVAEGFFTDREKSSHPRPESFGLALAEESLFPNLFRVSFADEIHKARVIAKPKTKLREYLAAVWQKVGTADEPPVDYWIENRVVHTFRSFDDPFWKALTRAGAIKPQRSIQSSLLANSGRFEDKNLFIKLLNRCLDHLCAAPEMSQRMAFSKDMNCHLFVAAPDTTVGRIKVKAVKQEATRTVYEAIPDHKDPATTQHWQHQAFRHFFLRLGQEWYLNVIPFWAFTADGQITPSRWQKSSSANMRKPEKNRAVLGHVMFWSSILCREPDLVRGPEPFRLHPPSPLQVSPSIRDAEWVKIAKADEKLALQNDLNLDRLL
jgi:hypothetical protein